MATPHNSSFDFGSPGTHYVYVYRDPRPGRWLQPIYVGKGCGDRMYEHWRYGSHNPVLNRVLDKIRSLGLEPKIEVVEWCSTEREAFDLEVGLIAKYGRRDRRSGTLLNLTDGGEGASGTVVGESTRVKLSEIGKRNWANDKAYARKLREIRKSKAYRRNMSSVKTGRRASDETKRKMSLSQLARYENDPSSAAIHAEKLRALQSSLEVERRRLAALREKWADPEWKAKRVEQIASTWKDESVRSRRIASLRMAQAKVTESDVLAIREAFANGGVSVPSLAEKYGMSGQNINDILRGKAWPDVRGPIVTGRIPSKGGAKLTESDVVAVVERLKSGVPKTAICSEFSVCMHTLRRIESGKSWKHVPR